MDWLDLLAVQGTFMSLLQHHSLKASILQHSAFIMFQLSHPYMTTRKTTASTIWIFVGKVMSLLFNTLSRFITAFLPRSKRLLILWLQLPSAMILEPMTIKCPCFHEHNVTCRERNEKAIHCCVTNRSPKWRGLKTANAYYPVQFPRVKNPEAP